MLRLYLYLSIFLFFLTFCLILSLIPYLPIYILSISAQTHTSLLPAHDHTPLPTYDHYQHPGGMAAITHYLPSYMLITFIVSHTHYSCLDLHTVPSLRS